MARIREHQRCRRADCSSRHSVVRGSRQHRTRHAESGPSKAVPWLNGGIPAVDAANKPILPSGPVTLRFDWDCRTRVRSAPIAPVSKNRFLRRVGSKRSSHRARMSSAELPQHGQVSTIAPRELFTYRGDISWYLRARGQTGCALGLPPTDRRAVVRRKQNQWALHFRGGPFPVVGRRREPRLHRSRWVSDGADFCVPLPPVDAKEDSAGIPITNASGARYAQSHFLHRWVLLRGHRLLGSARTGQPRATARHGDRQLHERASRARKNNKYCRRLRECHTRCDNGLPCSPIFDPAEDSTVYRCYDPASGPFSL